MKKNLVLFLVLMASVISILSINLKREEPISDALKFKEEYEQLNGQINANNKEYLSVEIDEENPIKYATYEEVVKLLEQGTGVIYFGFPECPWCRNAVPVLIDAANELQIEEIYYYNALPIRDKKELDENGNIVTTQEGTKEYYKLVELMNEHLPVYDGLNDETIKRLYFPTVVFVKEGQIINTQVSTLDTQENPYVALSEQQYNELKQIYTKSLNDVYDILCDEAC